MKLRKSDITLHWDASSPRWDILDRVYVAWSCLAMQLSAAHEFMNQEEEEIQP